MIGGFWTPVRFNLAKRLRADGLTYAEIGKRVGCSTDAARCVFRRRAKLPHIKVWTQDEFDTVHRMRGENATWAAIGLVLGRTTEAVKSKARLREYVPPKPSHGPRQGKGWPPIGPDLQANDDRYVAKLIEAAKLEGCYGPSSTGREVSVHGRQATQNTKGTAGIIAA